MSDIQPAAPGSPGAAPVPQGGVFALSSVLPLMSQASAQLNEKRTEWKRLRDAAAHAKSEAKRTRANLIVQLRVWGTQETGSEPIKTSAERNEFADADPDVQAAELAADLAQSAAMDARAALDHVEEYFGSLRSMLAIERDEWNQERHGG